MPEPIARRLEQAIAEKVFPGCVIGVVRADGEREVMPFGHFTYELGSARVQEDSVYDLASITKSIPTASLALTFIAEGKMGLGDTIKKYVPELQNDYGATVEDLLRYRVQGPRMSTLGHQTFEEIRTHVLETGFSGPPGEEHYSNVPAFILGMVVERVGEAILPALAEKYFFGPLGMSDTTFFPALRSLGEVGPHDIARCAPAEVVDGREIRGIVHDESARVFSRARRAVGHAGLFSTAPDMLNFLEALLQGKFPAVADGAEMGLGWQVHQPWFMGANSSEKTFGKTGFTGTSIVVDMKKGAGLVVLSNRTYPKRPPDAAEITSSINPFRADIADILLR